MAGNAARAASPGGLLSPAERNKLVAILARLGSDFDGERAAAGLLATRMLRAAGLGWDDLIPGQDAPMPAADTGAGADLALCRRHAASLSPWELAFVAGCQAQRTPLSERQRTKLAETAAVLRAKGMRP